MAPLDLLDLSGWQRGRAGRTWWPLRPGAGLVRSSLSGGQFSAAGTVESGPGGVMQLSQQQLFELKLGFLKELDEQYQKVRAHHDALLASSEDNVALQGIESFFPRIAGTAEPVGFGILGRLCAV